MKKLFVTSLALGFGLVGAHAQSDLSFRGFDLRLGFVYPLEDSVRDFTGNQLGIGVNIPVSLRLLPGATTFLSADWMSGAFNGEKGYIAPVILNQRFNLGSSVAGRPGYFFVGAGLASVDLDRARTVYALRAGLGFDISDRNFVEATYVWTDDINGDRPSTLGVHIGWKF